MITRKEFYICFILFFLFFGWFGIELTRSIRRDIDFNQKEIDRDFKISRNLIFNLEKLLKK